MRPRRLLLLLFGLAAAPPALGQAVATSAGPEAVSVTVYRDPNRSAGQPFNLAWLNGYALITERRTVRIPAGDGDLRFEGVAGGIIPESAIVSGLPDGVIEKNQNAWLLSPASLLDASLGRRVHIRRTDRATGKVTETDAVVRSGADGAVVLETPAGVESLRCTGLPETLLYDRVPEGLSAKPTLVVRTRSRTARRATLTLSYLATGFDWQADYIAELSPDRKHMDLFAWLTLANGDETSFVRADAQAVAGRLNRESDEGAEPQSPPLRLKCWPQGTTTSDLREIQPPPPAPPPSLARDGAMADLVMSSPMSAVSAMTVVLENLGDLKLYRVPEPVTVASMSQKQVALLRHDQVPIEIVYRVMTSGEGVKGATPTILTRNRREERLGVPLPAGRVDLYERQGDRRLLVGRGDIGGLAVGEDVEIGGDDSTDVTVAVVREQDGAQVDDYRLTVTNAKPYPVPVEVMIDDLGGKASAPGEALSERDGWPLWTATVPANGTADLRYRISFER